MSSDLNSKKDEAPRQVFVTFAGLDGGIYQSSGVSGVRKIEDGYYVIQFETPFSNQFYACVGSTCNDGLSFIGFGPQLEVLNVQTCGENGVLKDFPWVSVMAWGN